LPIFYELISKVIAQKTGLYSFLLAHLADNLNEGSDKNLLKDAMLLNAGYQFRHRLKLSGLLLQVDRRHFW
jgi:hypothetical protein